jgi:hypothetical protein
MPEDDDTTGMGPGWSTLFCFFPKQNDAYTNIFLCCLFFDPNLPHLTLRHHIKTAQN